MEHMVTHHRHWLRYVAVILVILTLLNGYLFIITESQQEKVDELQSQVSSMVQSCRAFYARLMNNVSALLVRISVLTSTLYGRIREDNATIANLNTTKPPGYENMTAILKEEIREDQSIITTLNNLAPSYAGLSSAATSYPCH